jgi:hypothetical protein
MVYKKLYCESLFVSFNGGLTSALMHFQTTTTGCFSDKGHNVARCCFQMSNHDKYTVTPRWTAIIDSKKAYPGKKHMILKCLLDLGFKNLGDNDHNFSHCCFQMSNFDTL